MEASGTTDVSRDFTMVDGDDLLNFSLDGEENEEEEEEEEKFSSCVSSKGYSSFRSSDDARGSSSIPAVEEELEWILNKDAFPALESSVFDILEENPVFGHHSPVSVLENAIISVNGDGRLGKRFGNESTMMRFCGRFQSPSGFPVMARKKRMSRKPRTGFVQLHDQQELLQHNLEFIRSYAQKLSISHVKLAKGSVSSGRVCLHCGSDKTPQWRAGPMGPKTLCNACGVRYKSGRLVPEYRPANSPSFSAALHSNSHRKVVEIRRQKQLET